MKVSIDVENDKIILTLPGAGGLTTNATMDVESAKKVGIILLDSARSLEKLTEDKDGQD